MATATHAIALGASLCLLHPILNTLSLNHLKGRNKGVVLSVREQQSANQRS